MAGEPLDIRFRRGLDVQNDARMVDSPFLLAADNVVFEREGGPRKRSGYKTLNPDVAGSATRKLSATSVVSHRTSLLALDDTYFYTRSDTEGRWISRDVLIPNNTSMRPVSPTQTTQKSCESVRWQNNWELHVYRDARSAYDIRYSIVDVNDGSYLVLDQVLASPTYTLSTATAYKIVRTATNLLVVYLDVNGYWARQIFPEALTAPGAAVQITTSTGIAAFNFDGVNTTTMAVNTTAGSVALYRLYANGTSTLVNTITGLATGTASFIDIAPYVSAPGKFVMSYASWAGTGNPAIINQEYYDVLNNVYLAPKNTQSYSLTGVGYIQQMAAVNLLNNAFSQLFLTYTVASGANSNSVTAYLNGSSSTLIPILNSAQLASKPFTYGANQYVFLIQNNRPVSQYTYTSGATSTYQSRPNQCCAFVYCVTLGRIVAQIGYGVSNPSVRLPDPMVNGAVFELPVIKTVRSTNSIQDVQPVNINGAYMYGITFTSAYNLQSVRMGDVRYFTGGLVASYDGATVTEQGFLLAPDVVDISESGSGTTAVGTYQVCAVYEWTDAQGNFHRSAPGYAVPYVVTTAGATLPNITISNLAATTKLNVTIALYTTQANGSIFYRTQYAAQTSTALGTQFINIVFPSGAISAETLYTTGNVLSNDPWPASALMTSSRNRVFMVNSEDNELITFSKAYVKGDGLAVSLAFQKRIAAIPGAITAIAAMDDKVVVFKTRGILFFSGQNGPNTDGSNDDFSPSQILTTEVGCTAKNSVLTTADGTYFQSEKGVWLLSRSLTLSFVGQPVAPLSLAQAITSAVLMPRQTNIRFGALGAPSLVYHYRQIGQYGDSLQCGQWTTFSNYSQFNATLHKGAYVFARSDGKVCVETDGYYKDDTTPVSFTLRTSWLRAGALLQWGTFSDMAALGFYEGPHVLKVAVYRDYRDAADYQLTYDTTLAITTSTWGTGALGSQATLGGDSDNTYVAHWKLPGAYAALAAVSLSLTDAAKSGVDFGASCQPLGLTLLGAAQNSLVHAGNKKRQ